MAVLGEHDRLVEAGLLCLGLGERGVHVRAGDLAPRGDRVVVGPPPAGDAARDPAVDVDIRPEGHREDGEGIVEVVQADADERAGFVRDRTDVRVFAVVAFAQELEGDPDEILGGVRKPDAHDPAGAVEPLVVLLQMQTVELLILGVPIRADALEHPGPVVEGVGQHAHLRVADGDELAVQERERRIRGRTASQRGRSGQLLHHAHTPCSALPAERAWPGLTHAPCRPAGPIVTGCVAVRPPV